MAPANGEKWAGPLCSCETTSASTASNCREAKEKTLDVYSSAGGRQACKKQPPLVDATSLRRHGVRSRADQ